MTAVPVSKVHVCLGSCGGHVDDDTFKGKNGKVKKTACDTAGCSMEGKPFALKLQCDKCHAIFDIGVQHACA